MWETIANSFALFAQVDNAIALLVGVIVGTVIGAIPGMTTPMGVALALPFTFTMQPVTGILLLLGVYKGGLYGGSITAILINAPGTPAASCTGLDGYPLAQRGEARRALDMALYASCTADFISNLSLIFFAGVLAQFALSFGSPEFFTLIVFSLTIIASVSGDVLLKGLGSACLGLLLSIVGLDLIYGTNRFIFGQVELMSGLNFIPVLIGLFGVAGGPQLLLETRGWPDTIRVGRTRGKVSRVSRLVQNHYSRLLDRRHSWRDTRNWRRSSGLPVVQRSAKDVEELRELWQGPDRGRWQRPKRATMALPAPP